MLAFMGFLMVIATIYLLLKGKSNPITVMIIVPVITALLVGTNFEQLGDYVGAGIETVMSNAVLFIFSIIFFGVMQDLGVFDPMVKWLLNIAGNSVIAITVVTGIIGIIAHIDGATATTVLITIPAMYPIYKKLGIRTEVLLCLTTASMGVMNLWASSKSCFRDRSRRK
ncbi:MAG: SLC13 family permease [Staphylococcus equorum]